MIPLESFFDEMDKIAEEPKHITKDKLKRLGTVMAVAGVGTGLGYGAARAIQRIKPEHIRKLKNAIPKKYRPMVGGAIGGLAGGYTGMKKRQKIDKYIEGGSQNDKPK